MWISGFLAIGILLITTKVYSLVLLTANIEDIKKIAKQFVSETVADHIGKLFVQRENHKIDISEENNLNDNVNKVSNEYFEIPRANTSSSEDVEKILKEAMQRVKEMKEVVDDVTKKKKPEKEKKKTKDNTKVTTRTTTKATTKGTTKTSDHYTYDFILTPEKTIKPKYEWKKGLNLDFFTTAIPDIFKPNEVYNSFTRGAISDRENDSGVNKIDISSEQEERGYEKSFKRLPRMQRLRYKSELNKETTKNIENTTTKPVLDYDNSIYVRKEIVATSGPIDLFKITALNQLSSSSSEYSLDKDIKEKNVNIDLYFRKLLDSKLKLYKNDTKEIREQIANITFNTSNKFFTKHITKQTKATKFNTTKRFKRKQKTNDLSYFEESDFYYSK